MSSINIYFIGDIKSIISIIFLDNLIKFSKKNKKFRLVKIIGYNRQKKINPVSNFKKKINMLIYFFFDKKHFDELDLSQQLRLKYKNFFEQAKLNKIEYNEFENINKKNIIKNSILVCCAGPILNKEFIKKFNICVNYHHAKLPDYRGVNSNGLEIYNNKSHTYFSWHYIHEKIDKGYVFYKEKVKINKKNKYMKFDDLKKIKLASKKIKKMLLLSLVYKRFRFSKSTNGKYYSFKYFKKMFINLEIYSYKQLNRCLEIFGGIWHNNMLITKIVKSDEGIALKDCTIKISKVKFMPIKVYKVLRFFKFVK
tara:strand:+ start:478 stop:1407 length:930 start_codon:yes stop_codon:yes gene_type:complete